MGDKKKYYLTVKIMKYDKTRQLIVSYTVVINFINS